MKDNSEQFDLLYKAIISIQTEEDCKAFFEDLCTFKEVEQMSQRAYAAKLFFEGKTYTEIIAETELSSTTLSRVSRAISHGSGGYKKFIAYRGKDGD